MTFGSKLEVVAAHRVGHLVLVTGDLDVPDPVSPQSFDLGKTVSGLAHPAGRQLSFATLSPSDLFSAGFGTFGVLAVVAVLGFVGFEQEPVLAEEARHPRRTIPAATYLALGVIAVVYAGAAWAMAAHAGQHHVVADVGGLGPGLLFGLGGAVLSQAAQWLFLTSLFAAALAFHNWRSSPSSAGIRAARPPGGG